MDGFSMLRLSKSQNFFIILSFLTCLSSFARVDLSEFYKHFKKGEYLKAQDIIGRIPYDEAFEDDVFDVVPEIEIEKPQIPVIENGKCN